MRVTKDDIRKYLRADGVAAPYRPAKGAKIDVVEDPQVDGCFAVQYESISYGAVQLMFCTQGYHGASVEEVLDDTCEECDFTTWPPTSGALKFL